MFEGDREKFSDWWRQMTFFLKYNDITSADKKAIAILSRMQGGIAGTYAAKWLTKVESSDDTIDWEDFKKDITTSFSVGNEKEKAEWDIEEFKQGKRHIADFLIEFSVLKVKAKCNHTHAIFLLKKHVRKDIIKTILGYPSDKIPTSYEDWMSNILSVGQGYESTEIRRDHVSSTGTTYGGAGQPMEIGRKKFEWNQKGEPKCHKCGTFGHIGRVCPKTKHSPGIKCYSCGKFGHTSKVCRSKGPQNRSMIEEDEEEKNDDEEPKQGFSEGSE
jgi:hypothetical protein